MAWENGAEWDRGPKFKVEAVQAARQGAQQTAGHPDLVAVHTDQVTTEEPREAGPMHAGQDEFQILYTSDGREAKDRAIRVKHEWRLLEDLRKPQARVATGKLKDAVKVREAIGRLKER